jgi:hypothetical protein
VVGPKLGVVSLALPLLRAFHDAPHVGREGINAGRLDGGGRWSAITPAGLAGRFTFRLRGLTGWRAGVAFRVRLALVLGWWLPRLFRHILSQGVA